MNLNSEIKHLIDRYTAEVGTHLPKKQRGEIVLEVRSMLLDMLDERNENDGAEPNEAMLLEIFKELGSPYELASSFTTQNYIIGPKMYHSFWMTFKGALFFITFFFIIGLGISIGDTMPIWSRIFQTIANSLVQYMLNIFQSFGVLVIVFAIFERVLPHTDWSNEVQSWPALAQVPFLRQLLTGFASEDWEPNTMKTIPKEDVVNRREMIFEMSVVAIVMILFNFFPHWIGIFGILGDRPWFVPLLSPFFKDYMILWNIYWVLTLGLNFILLSQRHWNRVTRWAHLGMVIFSGIIVYAMLIGKPFIGLTPEYLAIHDTSAYAIQLAEETLIPILAVIVNVTLILHLVVKIPLIIYKGFKLLRSSTNQTWQPAK